MGKLEPERSYGGSGGMSRTPGDVEGDRRDQNICDGRRGDMRGGGAPTFLDESVEEASRVSELRNISTSNIATIKMMVESLPEPPLFSLDPKKSLYQNEVNNTLEARMALVTHNSHRGSHSW
jgi:hypothetical protein